MNTKRQMRMIYGLLAAAAICAVVGALQPSAAVTVATALSSSPHMYTVVLDAGHGGIDGGASAEGVLEKDLNLAITLDCAAFMRFFGINVVLTRTDDRSLHTSGDTIRRKKQSDLTNRANIVNNTPNALYLSIHQNKFEQTQYRGAQTFFRGDNVSEAVAQAIQRNIVAMVDPGNHREHKPAPGELYVMSHITAPGVIVECGFISNPEERTLLCDAAYQRKLAFAIAMALPAMGR